MRLEELYTTRRRTSTKPRKKVVRKTNPLPPKPKQYEEWKKHAMEDKDASYIYMLALIIRTWFKGSGMDVTSKKKWWVERQIKMFQEVMSFYQDLLPNQSVLYRLTAIKKPENFDCERLVGKKITVETGNKPLQSWTLSLAAARKFYGNVYQNLSMRKDKRFAYVIVKKKFSKKQIVMTHTIATKFFEDVDSFMRNLKVDKEFKTSGGKLEGMELYAGRANVRLIKTKFLSTQEEIVVHLPKQSAEVTILEVITCKD